MDIDLYSNCKIRQMNSFKKSVTHNNSCMYYAIHKYFRGLVATNIIMSFIKYYCRGILKDNTKLKSIGMHRIQYIPWLKYSI